ncbi:hypothetical protein GCM10027299_52310 [Larkinella ripae]
MLMGDIDLKDNQGVDMADLKQHVARLAYVVLCAYSVRGGLWFVVRLPENQTPETLAAHFRYLQRLFGERFEINLDPSKGGNPCDLRFVSYDPEPYMNEQATIMSGSYTPLPPPRPRPSHALAYFSKETSQLLTRIVRFAESAGEGQRHIHLLKAARLIGGYVAVGRINEKEGIQALEMVASHWPNFTKSQKTILDGIQYGLASPIDEPNVYPNQTKASSPH